MIRVFVAVELSPSLKQTIAKVQGEMRQQLASELPAGLRLQWIRPEAMHVTVKFLGDIPEAHVEDLRHRVTTAVGTLPAFSVAVMGCGVFPDLRAPRILWIGLGEEQAKPGQESPLAQLAIRVEEAAESLGYARESRPFSPHLTVARIKEGNREVGRALARQNLLRRDLRLGALAVHDLVLMKSDLTPAGSIYTKLWQVPLAAGA